MKTILRLGTAILFIAAGIFHFLIPETYLRIMPPSIPWPLAMVYISGLAEIAGGLGLAFPFTRRYASWGLVALLIAVFPANVYMLQNHGDWESIPTALLWARLPLQGVLIWWVLWLAKP
ncbi:MAG: DoxX family membrane protein [Bryobacteraceae bacterium]